MKKSGKVKNPCKICFNTVTNKTGLQCQGACKKWAHFQCLNYPPGKIQDIKAGLIRVNCPCPDCDTRNKEEVVRDAGYICGKLKCPARIPPKSCKVPPCPKNFPKPGGKEVQCPEGCPLPDAPPPCSVPPKDLSTTSSDPPSSRVSRKTTPRGTSKEKTKGTPREQPKGTPKGTQRETLTETPRGSPRGTPTETPRGTPWGTPPCQSPTLQYPSPRPCPSSRPPCQPKESPSKCCPQPIGLATRSQPECPPPLCFPVKKEEDCSKSTCKDSVLNVLVKPLTVSKSYCMSFGCNVDSVMSAKIRKGSKSECGIKPPEATRQMLLGAMEDMYNTVGNFSNQFKELMCKMIEALEKS